MFSDLNAEAFVNALKLYSLNRLKSFNDACEACFNVLIEQGAGTNIWSGATDNLYTDLYQEYRTKQGYIQAEIILREQEIATIEAVQEDLSDRISYVQNALNFENYLGSTLWKLFSSYRREDTYSNSNYISDGLNNVEIFNNAIEFIKTANKEIYKSCVLQHSITATLKNLLVMREFDGLTSHFEVGNWIHIRSNGIVYNLRLLDYEIDFDNLENIPITFSDVKSVASGLSDLESIADQSRAMASSYDNVSRQASKGNSSRSQLDGWAEKGLSLTSLKILNNADSQDYVFDEHGMLFRKYQPITNDYNNKQLKIINSTIAMTDNNWVSVRTAIGEIYYIDPLDSSIKNGYGINGEVIIGKLILGEQLGIYNSGATLRFNKNGLYVSNDTVTFTANPNDTSKILAVTVNSNDIFKVTAAGDLSISGQVTATSGYIGGTTGWVIGSGCIYNGKTSSTSTTQGIYISPSIIVIGSDSSSRIKLESDGKMTANNVDLSGKITATEGYIGGSTGFTINSTSITNGKTAYDETTNNGVYIGTDGIGLGKGKFYVTKNGALTATNATITGTVTATSGEIGGWSLNSGKIYAGDGTNVKVAVMQAPSASITWVFAAGGSSHSGYSDCPFRVNKAGDLYATSATITGTITATGGKVGNWTINENYIGSSKTGGSFYISSASDSSDYWIRAHDAASGGGNRKFSVSKGGLLYASGATISGSITATSGTIGGCSISNGTLQIAAANVTSGTFSSARIPNLSADKITTGTLNASNVTISNLTVAASQITSGTISNARIGTLTADHINGNGLSVTNGTFTGSITSGSGKIGWWFIEEPISGDNDSGALTGSIYTYASGRQSEFATRFSPKKLKATDASYSQTIVWYTLVSNALTYSGNSDRRMKTNIESLNAKYDTFFDLLLPVRYKYIDGTSDRYHTGFVAQDVVKALEDSGLDTQQFAAVMLDHIEGQEEEMWRLRRDEFVSLNTWQIQKLKARVAELERLVAELRNT